MNVEIELNKTVNKTNIKLDYVIHNFLDTTSLGTVRSEETQLYSQAKAQWKHPPCKGIRIPESTNFLLVESGILGFGIRNPALRIRNPTKDWNPESNLLKIHSRLNWATRPKEKRPVYGKPPEGIDLNVAT